MKLRHLFIYLLFLPLCLVAQEVRVVAPEEVGQDAYFELKYIVENADVDDITLPKLSDFVLLSGPNLSTSSSFMLNGTKMTQSKTTTYTYILEPKECGTFTIPGATLEIDGKNRTAREVKVRVVPGGGEAASRRSSRSQGVQPIKNITEKDLFVRAIVSKTKVMEQEALVLTYRVYWRMGVGLSNIYLQKSPDFHGMVSNEIPITELNVSLEQVGGESYKVADRLKYVLIPQQEGSIEIAPLVLDCEIVESDPTMDAFDAFFNGRMRSRVLKRASEKLTIEVQPLPQPKPDDFCGVVGELSMKGKWATSSITAGAAAHYQLEVSGNGNLKLMLPPTMNATAEMDVYDVATGEELELTTSGHKGRVTYDYTIVPKSAGKFTLDALTLSYYNSAKGKYERLTTGDINMNVLPSIGGATQSNATEQQDIHTIHAGAHDVMAADAYVTWGGAGYLLTHLLLVGGCMGAFFLVKKYRHRDGTARKQKAALRKALVQLKAAEQCIQNKGNSRFYEIVNETISTYLMEQYKLQRSGLSRAAITDLFASLQIDAALTQRLLKVIDECEYAKFAPRADESGLKDLLQEVKDLLQLL